MASKALSFQVGVLGSQSKFICASGKTINASGYYPLLLNTGFNIVYSFKRVTLAVNPSRLSPFFATILFFRSLKA